MTKGILYYTGNNIGAPIFPLVQHYLKRAGLPIVSVSLQPIDFGFNIVLHNRKRSYPTMVKQILVGLEHTETDYVFFCEHDCLYPKSHFDFTPPRDDIFYYNENVWRWRLWDDTVVTHKRMLPLSCLCANTKFVRDHYRFRWKKINEWGLDHFRSREPRLARRWGYEPGTKKKKRGGITNDNFDVWQSKDPVVDIRHRRTFSRPKVSLKEFKHKPENWQKIPVENMPYWNLKEVFEPWRLKK